MAVAIGTGYLGVAATKNYWPFGDSSSGDSIRDLAGQLEEANSSEQRLAVLQAIGAKARIGHTDREAAVNVLTSFLRNQDGVEKRPRDAATRGHKAPAEVSLAFTLLGKSGNTYLEADLRDADLSGIDVKDLDFSRGVTLYGANLTGAVIVHSNFGSCNAGTANLTRAWFGGCFLSGLNLIDAKLSDATFPGTRLSGCQFAGAEISGVDFTKAQLDECDFAGDRLISSGRRNARWNSGSPPKWPAGFRPNLN
ncbi:pentapeptide repeat-containing protein [Micromonospora foliorum]|uniref:pentapeptide repeat-containing protein n=1 Tax=Micromonospora foliorum TaxID=2911210 RepID=UPI001EE794FF|nr:pentapeptide repeat-containing protein [Micromonospora foliorum]MCG5435399.1 pentapeptide repeat-containing protein [Micromonospora foliorum]